MLAAVILRSTVAAQDHAADVVLQAVEKVQPLLPQLRALPRFDQDELSKLAWANYHPASERMLHPPRLRSYVELSKELLLLIARPSTRCDGPAGCGAKRPGARAA